MSTGEDPLKPLLDFFADPANHGREIPEDVLHEARKRWFEWRIKDLPSREDYLLPPWATFPDTPRDSMAWRMGAGASYLDDFAFWMSLHSGEEIARYIEDNPESEAWAGFYGQTKRVIEENIELWTSLGFYEKTSD